jgi:hypothetical protein
MKKFNKLFQTGTRVKIAGDNEFKEIQSIDKTRQWVMLKGLVGSFQRGHILTFTNKEKENELQRN